MFVLSAVACILTFVLQKRTAGAIPPLPFLWRVQNAFVSYVIYVWKTLWPTRLAVFYPHPNDTLAIWQVIFAIPVVPGYHCRSNRFVEDKRPYLLTGWFWYLVMLIPVIGIVQVGEQGHADRYTYLPHIGLFVAMVWFAIDVATVRRSKPRVAVTTAVAVVNSPCSGMRRHSFKLLYWRNSESSLDACSRGDVRQ